MLVVGAGPTGLVLAIELLYRGTSVRVIDRCDGVTPESRAIGLQPRTLEVLDMMGLAERYAEQGHKVRELRFYASGKRLEEIQELTDQHAPEPIKVSDPSWLAAFRTHRRSAAAYRRGRVLLAGDAVHIHSPVAGQGMNTGIMEAHNLGWKLAMVASGAAPDSLLDSYGAERRPVAEDVLRLTQTMVRLGTVSDALPQRIRDVVVPALGRTAVVQR